MVDKSAVREYLEELGMIIKNEKSVELEIKKLRNTLKPGKERKQFLEEQCKKFCKENDHEVVKFGNVSVSLEVKSKKKKIGVVKSRQTEYLLDLFDGDIGIVTRLMKDLKDLSEEKVDKSKVVVESDKKRRK